MNYNNLVVNKQFSDGGGDDDISGVSDTAAIVHMIVTRARNGGY